jgi:putative oxidoreductase
VTHFVRSAHYVTAGPSKDGEADPGAAKLFARTNQIFAGVWRTEMIDILFKGVGWTDIAFLINRVAVGTFFAFSGYHKLFNAQRHQALVDELKALHIHALKFNQWWVPLVEFSAGWAVIIGFLAPLAALGLIVIILVADVTSGRERIKSYMPIDRGDRIADWLYLPETLYGFMLLIIVSAGAGPYSVDSAIIALMRAPG